VLDTATDPVSESDARFVFEHCEKLGEASARKAIASNYFSAEHRRMAELWLRLQDEKRQDQLNRENRRMAKRTEWAAWSAVFLGLLAVIQPWLGR
jgi:hypothetical protein